MNKKWHLWLRLGIVSILLGTLLAMLQLGFGEDPKLSDFGLPNLIGLALIFTVICFLGLGLLVFLSKWLLRFGRLLLRFGLWLFSWRNIKRGMIAFAVLAILAAIFYLEEDWRGQRAWKNYKQQWEAKCEKFDFASFIPPPVPDDQNFALTPIVASTYGARLDKRGHRIEPPNTNVVNRLNMELYRTNVWFNRDLQLSTWQKGSPISLEAWQAYYRKRFETNEVRRGTPLPAGTVVLKQNGTNDAVETIVWEFPTDEFPVSARPQSPAADVLLALSKYNSAIEELRQASRLPYSRFPLNYDEPAPYQILIPQWGAFRPCVSVLELRATAELSNGQSGKALDDIKLMLYLVNSIRNDPWVESHTTARIPLVNYAIQPIWEGLAEHKWSESELATIEQELARFDFLADYCHAVRGERAMELKTIDYFYETRSTNYITCMCGDIIWPDTMFYRLCPHGLYCVSKLGIACICQDLLSTKDEMNRRVLSPSLSKRDSYGKEVYKRFLPYLYFKTYPFFVEMLSSFLGGGDNYPKKFAFAQASVDMARVACALERYRLVHGEYPEKLDVLVPHFIERLPNDIINGQPLHYRRTSDGQFVLYSVGWDEKDDGGESGWVDDYEKHDWVWQYPVK